MAANPVVMEKTRRWSQAFVVVGVLALMPFAAHAADRVVGEEYVGSSVITVPNQCRTETLPNIGKACFKVKAKETRVKITIADLANPQVGYFYLFSDASGECVGQPADPTAACPGAGSYCHSTFIPIPKGSVELDVWVEAGFGPVYCNVFENQGTPGGGVAGTITARFRL